MGNHLDLTLPVHYRRKFKQLLYEYNRPFPLPYYFGPFLRGKHEVNIADLGSGPVCIVGNIWGNVKINIFASDVRQRVYSKLWEQEKCKLITPIEYQDMENLTYPDEFFDIVHCINALDHTLDVSRALSEMKRVVKKEGYIYLRHFYNQMNVHGGRGHYWNASAKGFSNGETLIPLEGFKTIDDGYCIISTMRK